MKSMTGFGRAEIEKNQKKMNIEMKSVNHRFLDINVRMPRQLLFLEEEVRKVIKSSLARGRVDVFVNFADESVQNKKIKVDMQLVKAYIEAAEQIKRQTKVKNDLCVTDLMRSPDVITFEDNVLEEDELRDLIIVATQGAVNNLVIAREKEGQRISQDIFHRIDILLGIVEKIEGKEDVVVEEYREKLQKRLSEYLKDTEIDEARFQQEVVYFADHCNITEEVVRLKSHLTEAKATLQNDQKASGRNMDFIVQEMVREFNTIGSKSSDLEITNWVLEGKSEVEKIREQVQNIE